ncbi:MAG: hypothetical protein LBN40_01355 [Oscillospiraceae bacterium]|jgi:hypothetical protein|nr:hypothetical protein [Oscillospiraceae bacterium]
MAIDPISALATSAVAVSQIAPRPKVGGVQQAQKPERGNIIESLQKKQAEVATQKPQGQVSEADITHRDVQIPVERTAQQPVQTEQPQQYRAVRLLDEGVPEQVPVEVAEQRETRVENNNTVREQQTVQSRPDTESNTIEQRLESSKQRVDAQLTERNIEETLADVKASENRNVVSRAAEETADTTRANQGEGVSANSDRQLTAAQEQGLETYEQIQSYADPVNLSKAATAA